MPDSLKDFMVYLQNEEMPDGLADMLDESLHWVICDVGLAKLLAIPELHSKHQPQELPLTREDASRIQLIQDVVYPRDGIRPNINPHSTGVHWAKMPARLFLFGPILDLVNTFREQQQVKVCWNCGKLYRPYQYQKEGQRYCSSECRKRAETKRRYQKRKEGKQKD